MNGLLLGFFGGSISGLATTLGGVLILFKQEKVTDILKNINMDFVTGMMLSASAFSLIYPAFSRSNQYSYLILNLIAGIIFILLVSKSIDFFTRKNEIIHTNKKAILYIIAMMAHNLPEGIASGASLTIGNVHQSRSLLSAIAIQNIPEGLTTALSFISLGANPTMAFLGNMLTGFVELIGGILGGYLSVSINGVLPYLLSFAGGAMMSITLVEVINGIKESSLKFFIRPGFVTGLLVMMVLSNI